MKTPMENASHNRRDERPKGDVGQLADRDRTRAVVVDVSMPRAGDLVRPNFVSLPAWFGCGKASAVLRLKAMDFVLVSDGRGVQRVASREQLVAAPADRGIAGCATPFGPAVALALPADA